MRFYTNVQCIKNKIFLREIDGNKRRELKLDYSPSLFISGKKDSLYKTLDGLPLDRIQFGSIGEARNFKETYKEIENMKVYGHDQYTYPYISDEYPAEIDYDFSKLNICTIDIEVECENGFPEPSQAIERVNAITMKMQGFYIVLGLGDWENTENLDNIKYYKFVDEPSLLRSFLQIWEKSEIDIVTGWNVNQFDMTYLVNRIDNLFGEKEVRRLSPWRMFSRIEKQMFGRMQTQVKIHGIAIIDYLDLYKKFTYVNRESYSLDFIAHVELGERKLDHSEFEQMHLFYKQDYQKYIDYNIKDVELVDKLEDKLKLMELLVTIAYQSKVNFEDVFSPVKIWDVVAFNELKKNKIVVPNKTRNEKSSSFEGAYVKDPKIGLHRWVLSFDLNSLYPHLIMQYNISPETLIADKQVPTSVEELLHEKTDLSFLGDETVCPSGYMFSKRKKGFLPKLMQRMYDDRVEYKKAMMEWKQKKQTGDGDPSIIDNKISQLDNKQMAAKILLNSAYGALGNQWFRYYDIRQAESITSAGQLAIKWIENKVNDYFNNLMGNSEPKSYVIASDTDSIYVALGDFVDKVFDSEPEDSKVVEFLDKIAKEKIEPYIDKCYQNLADYVNAYDQKMFMKREVIASKGIWTAKKRYILNVHDNEGVRYKTPELKIMGIEAVRSSTPQACREKIKESLNIIMNHSNEDLIRFIIDFEKEFKAYPVQDISFPRGVNGVEKYRDSNSVFKKGTPIHVKGVLFYNLLVDQYGIGNTYQKIKNGDKIKFAYLKTPNPIQNNAIAIMSSLPKEFNLDRYIDYNTQFEKSFLEPIKTITDCINWELKKQYTLDDFF
jgi:DNA polymerase elongation subunit (family B)